MPTTPKIDVVLKPVEKADLEIIAQGNISTLAPFHDDMEPEPRLADRLSRQARRLELLLSNPKCHSTKAVLASGPDQGKLVGVALWQFVERGEKPVNWKKRFTETGSEGERVDVEDDDESIWKGLDWKKWDRTWTEWDAVRDGFMKGSEHWYLVPLWVLPEYHGHGIGRVLISEIISRCDAEAATNDHGRSTPIYLEASADGKHLYDKLGFEQVGNSYYKEMIRWGPPKAV